MLVRKHIPFSKKSTKILDKKFLDFYQNTKIYKFFLFFHGATVKFDLVYSKNSAGSKIL